MSLSTIRPPLKAAMGVSSRRGSTSISMPRGGRPLVMAKRTPAWRRLLHRGDGVVGQDLVLGDQRPVHVGQEEADGGSCGREAMGRW